MHSLHELVFSNAFLFGRPYFTQAAAWAQAKMKWPRQPQMATYGTQAGHRQQGGPQGVHQGRGEGQGQGQGQKKSVKNLKKN